MRSVLRQMYKNHYWQQMNQDQLTNVMLFSCSFLLGDKQPKAKGKAKTANDSFPTDDELDAPQILAMLDEAESQITSNKRPNFSTLMCRVLSRSTRYSKDNAELYSSTFDT